MPAMSYTNDWKGPPLIIDNSTVINYDNFRGRVPGNLLYPDAMTNLDYSQHIGNEFVYLFSKTNSTA